jgi:hypothetical protein
MAWGGGSFPPGLEPPQEQEETVFSEESHANGGKVIGSRPEQTLSMHLTELQAEDPACIFIARRISRMGFRSQQALFRHFSKFGKVKRVLVANSKVKPFRNYQAEPRIRPGSLGFVVMQSANSLPKIFNAGREQTICGCPVVIEPFSTSVRKHSPPGSSVSTCGSLTQSYLTSGNRTGSGSDNSRSPGSGGQGSGASSGSGNSCKQYKHSKSDQAKQEKTEGTSSESQQELNESSDAGSADDPTVDYCPRRAG